MRLAYGIEREYISHSVTPNLCEHTRRSYTGQQLNTGRPTTTEQQNGTYIQTSDLGEYNLSIRASGAIHFTGPITLIVLPSCSSQLFNTRLIPKSFNHTRCESFNRQLRVARSRCTTGGSCKCKKLRATLMSIAIVATAI